jgi:hypothetical protein
LKRENQAKSDTQLLIQELIREYSQQQHHLEFRKMHSKHQLGAVVFFLIRLQLISGTDHLKMVLHVQREQLKKQLANEEKRRMKEFKSQIKAHIKEQQIEEVI